MKIRKIRRNQILNFRLIIVILLLLKFVLEYFHYGVVRFGSENIRLIMILSVIIILGYIIENHKDKLVNHRNRKVLLTIIYLVVVTAYSPLFFKEMALLYWGIFAAGMLIFTIFVYRKAIAHEKKMKIEGNSTDGEVD